MSLKTPKLLPLQNQQCASRPFQSLSCNVRRPWRLFVAIIVIEPPASYTNSQVHAVSDPYLALTRRRQSRCSVSFTHRYFEAYIFTMWVISYLWRQVEAQITTRLARELVRDEQRHLVRQANRDLVGETRSLAEVDEIFEGECQRDGLAELDLNVLFVVFYIGVLSQGDGAVADVAAAGELDAVLARVNCD